VLAFSAGMAIVLVSVGWLAWKFKTKTFGSEGASRWQRSLSFGCGVVLAAMGLYLFLQV
jgi:cytochrome c biogenesis protein CcdA